MSGTVADRKRLIRVTAGNLRNSSLSIGGHYDFFPPDCVGASRKSANGRSKPIQVYLDGLNATVETDIGTEAGTGTPRRIFRGRKWVREFFEHHQIKTGDVLAIEKVAARRYRLVPPDSLQTEDLSHFGITKSRRHKQPTAAEFFAGIGLVRLALEQERWHVLFANDICSDKAEMYRHHWPDDNHLLVGDIHKIQADDVPSCDLATASFPCNDLSIAGAWRGLSGKESSAFWGLIRILKDMGERRPPLVMLENVLGFLQSHGGKDFETALLALNGLGYTVDAFILNAVHWVPQSRARLFVVANAEGKAKTRNPYAMESDARPDPLCIFINTHPNIRWDIRDLPRLPKLRLTLEDIVEDLPDDDPHWWNTKRSEYFFNQLSDRHLQAARRMIGQKNYTFATAFRRVRYGRSMAELRTDGIAGCLRTPHLTQGVA